MSESDFDIWTEHYTGFSRCMNQLREVNNELLNPDEMAWGRMTEEEAEASFMEGGEYYDEWGDKSMNILLILRDWDDDL